MFRKTYKKQRGFTLIETAMALGLVAIGLVGFTQLLIANSTEMKNKAAADRMIEMVEATKVYLQANHTDVRDFSMAQGTPGSAVSIPVTGGSVFGGRIESLQSAGYLTSSFQNRNSYNQVHNVLARIPNVATPDVIEVMIITSGGNNIASEYTAKVGALIGGSGGYVAYNGGINNVGGDTLCNGACRIQGSYGGWRDNAAAANWGAAVALQSGHLAANLGFEVGSVNTNYLYRTTVPGHPEANMMSTDLHMTDTSGTRYNIDGIETTETNTLTVNIDATVGRDLSVTRNITAGNNISATNDIDAGNDLTVGNNATITGLTTADDFQISSMGNQSVREGIYYAAVHSNNDRVNKPVCPAGLTEQIFVAPASFSDSGTGSTISSVQTFAASISAAQWQVYLRVRTEFGWQSPSSSYGKILVMTKCT